MHTLLLSTYELGHQPLTLAWPQAVLEKAGIDSLAFDLSVQEFPEEEVVSARLVAISVPMLTALRLGVETAKRIRELNPKAHICFFGHYALLNEEYLKEIGLADSILAGEVELALVRLAQELQETDVRYQAVQLDRINFPVPKRSSLPELNAYAHLEINGEQRLAGYVESTRGCLHTCRHCPIVPVYEGRFFAVPVDVVLEDIRQQVLAGAAHITFGDPDFLNGPTHALRIVKAMHEAFPDLTFDFTAKVDHLIRYADILPQFVAYGALYVVSAFESTSNVVLEKLEKGHTANDLDTVVRLCREVGLAVQATWVAFSPWTTINDYIDMLDWVRAQGLIADVPAVQFSVRLLVPPHSALLVSDGGEYFHTLDAENFTYRWAHPDPRMDELYREVMRIVENGCGCDPVETFREIEALAYQYAEIDAPEWGLEPIAMRPSPRLTEDWFC